MIKKRHNWPRDARVTETGRKEFIKIHIPLFDNMIENRNHKVNLITFVQLNVCGIHGEFLKTLAKQTKTLRKRRSDPKIHRIIRKEERCVWNTRCANKSGLHCNTSCIAKRRNLHCLTRMSLLLFQRNVQSSCWMHPRNIRFQRNPR